MSHVSTLKSDDVPLRSIDQMRRCVDMMNRLRPDTKLELVKRRHYTLYASQGERLPQGLADDEAYLSNHDGHNAEYVIRIAGLTNEQRGRYYSGVANTSAPYEIGVVKDPSDPTRYVLKTDFFMDGYGLVPHIGAGCKDLLMFYQMAGVELQAEELGMPCEWDQKADGEYIARVTELTGMGA